MCVCFVQVRIWEEGQLAAARETASGSDSLLRGQLPLKRIGLWLLTLCWRLRSARLFAGGCEETREEISGNRENSKRLEAARRTAGCCDTLIRWRWITHVPLTCLMFHVLSQHKTATLKHSLPNLGQTIRVAAAVQPLNWPQEVGCRLNMKQNLTILLVVYPELGPSKRAPVKTKLNSVEPQPKPR